MDRAATLKGKREMAGYTQQSLADSVGVHVRTVSRWERGALPVPDDVLEFLDSELQRQRTLVDSMLDEIENGASTILPYDRTDGFANAVSRQVAEHLLMLGEPYWFEYEG